MSNTKFRYQLIVSRIKSRKRFARFMRQISLFKKQSKAALSGSALIFMGESRKWSGGGGDGHGNVVFELIF